MSLSSSAADAAATTSSSTSGTTVFVACLPLSWLSSDLSLFASSIGPIKRCFIVTKEGQSRGCGFIEYALEQDAERALHRLNQQEIEGTYIQVERARDKRNKEQQHNNTEKRQQKRDTPHHQQHQHQHHPHSPTCLLLVTNFPPHVSPSVVSSVLSSTGVSPCHVLFPSVETTRRFSAARLTFNSSDEAQEAANKLQHVRVPPYITLLRCVFITDKSARLICRNIPFHITDKQLLHLICKQLQIKEENSNISITLPIQTDKPHINKGFAFIQFPSMSAAEQARDKMHGMSGWGRTLDITWALDKTDYQQRPELKQQLPCNSRSSHKQQAQQQRQHTLQPEQRDETPSNQTDDVHPVAASSSGVDDHADEDSSISSTLFVRNLHYETTDSILFNKFAAFGPLRYATVVREQQRTLPHHTRKHEYKHSTQEGEENRSTHTDNEAPRRSKGVGFVCFVNKSDADRVLAHCESLSDSLPASETAPCKVKGRASAVASLVSASSASGITLDGRLLNVVPAVSKDVAASLSERAAGSKEDKRNLYLAREGVILANTPSAVSLSPNDLSRRERYYQSKKAKLDNPNYRVSQVRLSVRNLPIDMQEKHLKEIFSQSAMEATDKQDREPIRIKQVKIERDKQRPGADGIGRSKRYGFVEFSCHSHALSALRFVNNNPNVWQQEIRTTRRNSEHQSERPIVEFALDDIRKVKQREKRIERQQQNKTTTTDTSLHTTTTDDHPPQQQSPQHLQTNSQKEKRPKRRVEPSTTHIEGAPSAADDDEESTSFDSLVNMYKRKFFQSESPDVKDPDEQPESKRAKSRRWFEQEDLLDV